jgi:hypothetical protein
MPAMTGWFPPDTPGPSLTKRKRDQRPSARSACCTAAWPSSIFF